MAKKLDPNFYQSAGGSSSSVCSAYVAGFMFSHDRTRVSLIRKTKPAWQAGLLNGIGGKIEPGEKPLAAMVREFEEETGYSTTPEQWAHYHTMSGTNDDGSSFSVDFFATVGDTHRLKTMEAEKVEVGFTEAMHPLRRDTIENLCWLIALAIDHLQDGRPAFVTANY